MKVTDLTLFAPDVTSISIACLILKELTLVIRVVSQWITGRKSVTFASQVTDFCIVSL